MRKVKVNFADFWDMNLGDYDIRNNPVFKFLSRAFSLEISQQPDYLFYSIYGKAHLKYDCVRIFYTLESYVPNFKKCDYAVSHHYPLTKRNYRIPAYKFYGDGCEYNALSLPKDADAIIHGKTKFCNFIQKNKMPPVRNSFYDLLSAYKTIGSAGFFRNNVKFIEEVRSDLRNTILGDIKAKVDFMRPYKFSIAFENASYPGYTTEKIVHAFAANTIPIYWGNPLVHLDFNPASFINCHDYNNFDEVMEEVKRVDRNEDLYRTYLREPALHDNRCLDYLTDEAIYKWFEGIFSSREIIRERDVSPHLKFQDHLSLRQFAYLKKSRLDSGRDSLSLVLKNRRFNFEKNRFARKILAWLWRFLGAES